MERFCITQKTPTQKSATAKFAKKKFVMDLSLLDNVTTRITSKLPVIKPGKKRKDILLLYVLIITYDGLRITLKVFDNKKLVIFHNIYVLFC